MITKTPFNKEYPLSEMASFVGDKIPASEISCDNYISTDNMLVDRGGIEPAIKLPAASKFNHFKTSDTLFSNIRTYFRKVWLADIDGGASPDVLIFRTNDAEILDPAYLYYIISNETFTDYTVLTAKGVKMPRGDKVAIMQYKFYLPEPDKQKSIAQTLRSLDQKIENNRKINETLEGMAQAVFKSWFVDFDPVRAKMAALEAGGCEADVNLAAMTAISGKNLAALEHLRERSPAAYEELKSTANLFPSTLQESDLGIIPDGWEASEIGDEVTVVGGGTPSTKNSEFWDGGTIHWTTPRDMSNLTDKILIDTDRRITDKGLSKISSGLLPVDTVLMSSRAPVGYLAIAKVPVAINQGYIAMKCEQSLSPEFVVQWCASQMEEIKQRASGTTFAEISKKSFKPIPIIVPTLDIIEKYNAQVKSIYLKIENNIREMTSLSQIRDSLLPRLLSGEIDVSELQDEE